MGKARVIEKAKDLDDVMPRLFVARALAESTTKEDLEWIVGELRSDWGFSELEAKMLVFEVCKEAVRK